MENRNNKKSSSTSYSVFCCSPLKCAGMLIQSEWWWKIIKTHVDKWKIHGTFSSFCSHLISKESSSPWDEKHNKQKSIETKMNQTLKWKTLPVGKLKLWKTFLGWKYTQHSTPINIQMKPTLFPQSRLLRNTNHEQNKKKNKKVWFLFPSKYQQQNTKRKRRSKGNFFNKFSTHFDFNVEHLFGFFLFKDQFLLSNFLLFKINVEIW